MSPFGIKEPALFGVMAPPISWFAGASGVSLRALLPKSGAPVLFTGMSNRVHGWIKRNSHLAEVIYSTDLGQGCWRACCQNKVGCGDRRCQIRPRFPAR